MTIQHIVGLGILALESFASAILRTRRHKRSDFAVYSSDGAKTCFHSAAHGLRGPRFTRPVNICVSSGRG